MDVWLLILQSAYFMLPAYFANASPVLFKNYLKFLAVPVDFGKKLGGEPVFGNHKTWRGIIVASLTGIVIFYIQQLLYAYGSFRAVSLVDYPQTTLLLGFLLGFGAIFGDLVKSFFKRRLHHTPGSSWIPFDQLDFVAGALLFSLPVYVPSWQAVVAIVIVTFFGDILVRHIGYYLKIVDKKW